MQCGSCGFENMPGSESCARCSSPLGVATMTLDVHPPRAGKWRKRLRKVTPHTGVRYAIRDHIRNAGAEAARARIRWGGPMAPWAMLWRSILPGWAHLRAGQLHRGHLFLWSFLPCFFLGLLMMGTGWGSLLLGIAFSIHASAFGDMLNQYSPTRDFRSMMSNSIQATLGLALLVYLPLWLAISHVASVRTIEITSGPLNAGDVVLVDRLHPTGWPQRGAVVLYNLPFLRLGGGSMGHEHVYWEYEGEHIDRVVAVGGDQVLWKNGKLFINGALSPFLPLDPTNLPEQMQFVAPKDACVIFPSTTPRVGRELGPGDYVTLSCITPDEIEGSVYMRLHPLRHMAFIH